VAGAAFKPPELSRRFGPLELTRLRAGSLARGLAGRKAFAQLESFCVFLGYPRSGHSLVGALLDAHPRMVVAHELDVLRYVQAGFGRTEIFQLLLENSRRWAAEGREQTGYSYSVPDQWQGRFDALRVIGDKKGGMSTFRLRDDPGLLDRLAHLTGLQLKVVHVVRNPYDNIATMSHRKDTTQPRGTREQAVGIPEATLRYFSLCETVASVSSRLGPHQLFDLRHEDLVAAPEDRLRALCEFLGQPAREDYLRDCASIVFRERRRSRDSTEWSSEDVLTVARESSRFGFLAGYSFES
jgi:hypothetical protein